MKKTIAVFRYKEGILDGQEVIFEKGKNLWHTVGQISEYKEIDFDPLKIDHTEEEIAEINEHIIAIEMLTLKEITSLREKRDSLITSLREQKEHLLSGVQE
jgi:hypothetical protein